VYKKGTDENKYCCSKGGTDKNKILVFK